LQYPQELFVAKVVNHGGYSAYTSGRNFVGNHKTLIDIAVMNEPTVISNNPSVLLCALYTLHFLPQPVILKETFTTLSYPQKSTSTHIFNPRQVYFATKPISKSDPTERACALTFSTSEMWLLFMETRL